MCRRRPFVDDATGYAVPFLIAFAAGDDVDDELKRDLVLLLGLIAQASSSSTDRGSYSVAERVREAFQLSAKPLRAVATKDKALKEVVEATIAHTSSPDEQSNQRLRSALKNLNPYL